MGDKTQLIWAARIFQFSGRFHLGGFYRTVAARAITAKARDMTVVNRIRGARDGEYVVFGVHTASRPRTGLCTTLPSRLHATR